MITSRLPSGSGLFRGSGFIGSIIAIVVATIQWTTWLPDSSFSTAAANAVAASTHVSDGRISDMIRMRILTIFGAVVPESMSPTPIVRVFNCGGGRWIIL